MNLLYETKEKSDFLNYKLKRKVSLLGCNNGIIPWAIKKYKIQEITTDDGWHLDISKIFSKWDEKIVIDLKPNHSGEIFLVELTDVYGYNHSSGWTALLYRFSSLYNKDKSIQFNRNEFELKRNGKREIIYSFLYALGHVKEHEIKGKWSPPFGTMTGLLMWEDSYRYFSEVINDDKEYK